MFMIKELKKQISFALIGTLMSSIVLFFCVSASIREYVMKYGSYKSFYSNEQSIECKKYENVYKCEITYFNSDTNSNRKSCILRETFSKIPVQESKKVYYKYNTCHNLSREKIKPLSLNILFILMFCGMFIGFISSLRKYLLYSHLLKPRVITIEDIPVKSEYLGFNKFVYANIYKISFNYIFDNGIKYEFKEKLYSDVDKVCMIVDPKNPKYHYIYLNNKNEK